MPTRATAQSRRKDTAKTILALVRRLIQARGYNAISYQNIAGTLGITKASVHYHFPAKSDLGAAVIRDYHEAHRDLWEALQAASGLNALERLKIYLAPFVQVAESGELVCLCGVLAGEFVTLPGNMQAEVTAFFQSHLDWLSVLLEMGRKEGLFHFDLSVAAMANWIMSSLQGTLLLVRVRQDAAMFDDLLAAISRSLGLEKPIRLDGPGPA